MQLTINGVTQHFMPIRQFRQQHNLPEGFGMAAFQPKDFEGLARLDAAGPALGQLRAAVLDSIPQQLSLGELSAFLEQLGLLFRSELYTINDRIGLQEAEVEFAAAGFSDMNQQLLYALLRQQAGGPAPDFVRLYREWIDQTVRVAAEQPYTEGGRDWRVQVVYHVYGRAGLLVHMDGETAAVQDGVYLCPAEGFMAALLHDTAGLLLTALSRA